VVQPGTTLTPGLFEGHSHILLHAYSEASWTDQVSREGLALRVARATNHLRATLDAGFTTVRDLGTEGAAYADVELKQAVSQGIIPGPRILASTRASVPIAVHANTAEGMRRAALAGVETIEHGGEGTPEVFKLMVERHIALCPTITAGAGPWPPADPNSPAANRKRASFKAALDAGV